jgi:hypothetical protein
MTWCASTGSYLTHTASSSWNCPRKVISADIPLYAGLRSTFCRHTLLCRHIIFVRHFAAGAEAQVSELSQRVKELTGMPDLANLLLNILYFKSFSLCHCFLSSNPFNFKLLQMRRLHWRPATRTVCPQWMWPSNWTSEMPVTRPRQNS